MNTNRLSISIGQCTEKGRKDSNQDFHGFLAPDDPLLSTKGIAVALADGISSSDVSHIASEAAIRGLLDDYFCTSETLSVKRSVEQVLLATNSWLFSQTQKSQYKYDKDRGYVTTLSGLVFKSTTAHLFHLGDSRVYRVRADIPEQLTEDHRLWVGEDKSYLSRAMGVSQLLDIDYSSFSLEQNDIFILATDGVYEYVNPVSMNTIISNNIDDLDKAAEIILNTAFNAGSGDNLTVQIVRVNALPKQDADERVKQLTELPFPPILDVRQKLDDFVILKKLHSSARSHVYLAEDTHVTGNNALVVIKTPSIDLKDDPAYLERFLLEEWIARRISSAHVLKPCLEERSRGFLYTCFEYIEGQTLSQWMIDNPSPSIEKVRSIVEQIAAGLQVFHRKEMLHQDLRPENILIDSAGVVKIIDFGSTKVAGLEEITNPIAHSNLLGTAQYTAPEYFLGDIGTDKSDLFSLAVITYQMLTGNLPYGAEVAKAKSRASQNKLQYKTALHDEKEIPAWIDDALKRALQPNPFKRQEALSEFIYDLRFPSKAFLSKSRPPLLERNPVAFWQSISAILFIIIVVLLNR